MKLNNDYSTIKIELILSILDNITKSVTCKLYDFLNSNFLCIKHYKKINLISVNNNLGGFENTVNNISSDLEQIDTNKDNITSNLEKIDDLSAKLVNSIKSKKI